MDDERFDDATIAIKLIREESARYIKPSAKRTIGEPPPLYIVLLHATIHTALADEGSLFCQDTLNCSSMTHILCSCSVQRT